MGDMDTSLLPSAFAETDIHLLPLADFTHCIFRITVITVICAPDDGWSYHPKHIEQFTEI